MSIFAQLQATAQNVQTQDVDYSGKFTVDSDAYRAVIKMAYLDKSEKGAAFLGFEAILKMPNGKDRTYTEQIYFSKQDGSLTYNDKDGNPQPMVGFVTVDTICKLATGKPFAAMQPELIPIKIRVKGQEEVHPREVLKELLGQELILGIIETKEDHYNKPGETQLKNQIRKLFSAEGRTINEHEANINAKNSGGEPVEAKYIHGWKEANSGKLQDKSGKGGQSGRPAQTGNPMAAPKSLI